MSVSSLQHVTQHTSGFSYRDLTNVSRLLTMKVFSLTVTREGRICSHQQTLHEEDIQSILNSFTPSALIGFDVRSRVLIWL